MYFSILKDLFCTTVIILDTQEYTHFVFSFNKFKLFIQVGSQSIGSLDIVILSSPKRSWGAYALRCQLPDLLNVLVADPVSKLLLVLFLPNLHG